MLSLVLTLALAASQGSPNLLDNGGFELNGLSGWQLPQPPAAKAIADTAVNHTGKASCRITVPSSAPVSWYSVSRRLEPSKPGKILTISAFVQTAEVRNGAGAYISLAFFDLEGKRLSFGDSPGHRLGTGDWQRLTATTQVPQGCTEMRAIVLIHGHGTAWFDDVQVEQASAATGYQPSDADVRELARLDGLSKLAADWKSACPRETGQARIGILDEVFPAGESCCPSDPAVLEQTFVKAGYAVARLNASQIANPLILDPAEIDLLVLPTGDAFPSEAHSTLLGYLERRGAFLTMGGYAFDRPLVRFEGKWMGAESIPLTGPSAPITPLNAAGWHTSTNGSKKPALRDVPGPHGGSGIELHTDALDLWDSAMTSAAREKLPPGWSATRFWAKGDAQTQRMEFEWQEDDGSRWTNNLPLSTNWKEYTIFPGDLSFRTDSHAPGRGKKGDQFRPEHARGILVGISAGIATRGSPHTVWFSEAEACVDTAASLRKSSSRINTRWAPIRDALWPEADQIGVFDPSFPLRQIARTTAAAGQEIVGRFELDGALAGYSALGMLGLNGHGFGPNRARWIPLLECSDSFGRPRGHAGAILQHFTGTFAGSSWAIFGVTSRDLFAKDSPALEAVLLPSAARLLHRIYLHETDTAFACYREGEVITFRTKVSNFDQTPRTVEVRFVTGSNPVGKERVNLTPGETKSVEWTWKPARFDTDFIPFTAELWENGNRIDREDYAFVVWTPALLAKGPQLRKEGTRFLLDGRARYLMGCQTHWGQNGSVTARSPAVFDRDFRQMRDYGLLWTRLFLPFKTEEDKRISDAAVQLAQKYGLVLYHTPNLPHTADPAELRSQQATAREIATRYREVPGLAIDICNEPSFKATDPALLQRFGRAGKTEGSWNDPDVSAFWHCMVEAERKWEQATRSAISDGHDARLVSVGWSQGWGGGETMKDPVLASLGLDFTDRHYYGPPAKLASELKDLDLRSLGKPFILGECGAKNHPSFKAADPWGMGDDDESFDARFLYLGHHALGLGAAAISSWHWRDPVEGVFPCGIVHPTGVPRPTALAWRAMALAFAPLKPKSVTPPVCLLLPDEARMSGKRDVVIRAFHRATDLLVCCRVDFALLPASLIDRLPKETKAIVYPLPLNPSDEILQRLTQFVKNGGWLYLSGDIGYDRNWKPTSGDRLRTFCGVEKIAGGATPLEPIQVKLAGAVMAAPGLTRFQHGIGEVWFASDLVELSPQMKPEHLDRYRQFLQSAGVPRVVASPERDDLHVFRVEGEDADAYVFYNAGPAVTVTIQEVSVELSEHGTGYLVFGHDFSLRALEAQGRVTRGGKPVVQIRGHAFVISRNGADLATSDSLLVLPIQPGEVRLFQEKPIPGEASVGEIKDGNWRHLTSLPLRSESEQQVLPIPAEFSREMIRLGAERP